MSFKAFQPPLLSKQSHAIRAGEEDMPKFSSQKRRFSKSIHTEPAYACINTADWAEHESRTVEVNYSALWRRYTFKKNKTWEGDGILTVRDDIATLFCENGKWIGSTRRTGPLFPDMTLSINGKEVQVGNLMKKKTAANAISGTELDNSTKLAKQFSESLADVTSICKLHKATKSTTCCKLTKSRPQGRPPDERLAAVPDIADKSCSIQSYDLNCKPTPRHDPSLPGALVMRRPDKSLIGRQLVDVVVDPLLSRHLREHQREGVKFLYECVMGMRPYAGNGAILGDEMGLGKTLQIITLLWTLMKQSPFYQDQPIVRKALIVCPATVVNNWRKEFRKWLGNERLGVLAADDKNTRLTDFTLGKSYTVMIIGYEKLRAVIEDVRNGAGIDIVIADEGHRLKTAQNKSALAIRALDTTRRIILSGTPLQNDLSEFYFMVDFVNPGLLGRYNTFKREFEIPIIKCRQRDASSSEVARGQERYEELNEITALFIIRRRADLLSKYLPRKTEHVLFCRPTAVQAAIYRSVVRSKGFSAIINSSESVLQLIATLKKLCNSPLLLGAPDDRSEGTKSNQNILQEIPPALLKSPGASGKIRVLDSLLHKIRTETNEKVVIVSHYTSTLNLVERLLTSLDYTFLRLDGNTPQSKRQEYVDKFNRSNASTYFVFLLSAKSGGLGLNLIGASRLILFDNDWNPSTDVQAMARIHRDGQPRPCKIYRLLIKGALDEKIFQRQATKQSLADSVIDGKVSSHGFSREELMDLFRFDEQSICQTHELLSCSCNGDGALPTQLASLLEDDRKSVESEHATIHDDAKYGVEPLNHGNEPESGAMIESYQEDVPAPQTPSSKIISGGMSLSLIQYRHIDVTRLIEHCKADTICTTTNQVFKDEDRVNAAKLLVEDDLLFNLLKDEDNRIDYIFTRSSV